MATIQPGSLASGKRAERVFFSSYVIALALVIFAGFAPSFFLRDFVAPYSPLRPLRVDTVVHGVVATGFLLAFPLQTSLIAANRRAQHMMVGKWAFALGVLMLPVVYWVAASTYRQPVTGLPEGIGPAAVVSVPLFGIMALAVLLVMAWKCRFDAQAHKRIMVVIACTLSDPGITRLPFWGDGITAFLYANIAILLTTLPLWLWDIAVRRRIHWATVFGTGLLLIYLVGRMLMAPTAAWASFVATLPGFGPL